MTITCDIAKIYASFAKIQIILCLTIFLLDYEFIFYFYCAHSVKK